MIGTGIEKRIQVQQVIESQLPEYILSESPKTVDFLRQYYISQEHRGGVVDISDNLDQYLKLDNLTPEVIVGVTTLSTGITTISDTIEVSSTKGFPDQYGLLKIDDEIISYTGLTTNTFTGCIRGFSGITSYTDPNNPGELVFATSTSDTHTTGSVVNNLSVRFLQEFYKKVKSSLTPGLEDTKFVPQIDVSNFIKESKSLYGSKGTAESFRILFNVLYGVTPKIVDLEELLIKPSGAEYIRREIILTEVISGDPNKLLGQTITKSTDDQTFASISEVEVITRNRKTYYKLSLFVGYNDRSGIKGTFTVPGKSKVIGNVSVGSSVITVDSTVGFGTTGTVVSGINTITYTDKTVNQFLNCTGITTAILTTDDIRSDEIYFGYEDGDITKKVELRITGVLSNFEVIPSSTSSVTTEGELISVKNLGEVVPNPEVKNKKEVFFNSWIYNTSCTFQINNFAGIGTAFLSSTPDKSNLKIGDKVDIIRRGGDQQVEVSDAIITDITQNNGVKFNLGGQSFTIQPNIDYDIRRKLDKAFSTTSELQYGNNVITANVQNVYNKEDDEYYVASTSLPSYDIQESVFKSTIPSSAGINIQGFNNVSQKYSIISFPQNTRFITGDSVFYKPKNPNLVLGGLEEGVYYIKKLAPNNQIKLYSSRSFIPIDDNLEFTNGETVILVNQGTTAAGIGSTTNIGVGGTLTGSLTITDSGTGYNAAPSIIVVGGGSTADSSSVSFTTTITNSGITSISISGGQFFTEVPNFIISAPAVAVGVNTIKVDSIENIQVGDTISGTNVPNSGITSISSIDSQNNILTVVGLTTSAIENTSRISVTTEHSFVLLRHKNEEIGVQKILKKFPAVANIQSGDASSTDPGATGILVNGVEITNYKSEDKIYYGPLTDVKVLNGGSNFDVINIPSIEIPQAGSGVTALVQPVVKGDLKEVLVDQQGFDIEDVLSLSISGGNGTGAVIKPVVRRRFREMKFDGRTTAVRGGIDVLHDQLIFSEPHNLLNGEPLVYDNNENPSLGVGIFSGSNLNQNKFLSNGSVYFPQVIGISSVRLYENVNDFNAGINTVGFTTINAQGTHIFKTLEKKKFLRSVVIEDSGSNYTNRKLIVRPTGISTIENTINFTNHGFESGEVITYNFAAGGTVISGLSSSTRYKVIKLDSNSFRVANAGASGTDTSDYDRNDYVKITSTGSGLQEFAYPPIELNVSAIYSPTTFTRTGDLVITPVIRGSIIQNYLYESGTNYGSDILNFEKKPGVITKTGKVAELKVIASKGRIAFVDVRYGGKEYFSPPDLELVGVGTGVGAKLRPVVDLSTGIITDVKIINPGIGYSDSPTVNVIPAGSGQIFEPSVRELTVNNLERFDDEILLKESETNLQYAVVGYNTSLYNSQFNDPNPITGHSPIVGWAYDGNPIYGPYGYRDAFDSNSSVQILDTGYDLDVSNVSNRPSNFSNGFFVNDYKFNDSGHLDKNNGRFCKTPEYPNGVYAYFVGVTTGLQGNLVPKFPYFIGDTYRSKPDADNFSITQTNFDFNENNLTRNTLPYVVADPTADHDFFIESNEIIEQNSVVESVTKGNVQGFQIVESGDGYKVNDSLNFDNTGTSGEGASAFISKVEGKEISSVTTTVQTYDDVVFVRDNDTQVSAFISTSHTFSDNDNIVVSGLSTSISGLTDSHKVGVSSEIVVLYKAMGANATAGVVTDIYVSSIPDRVSAGSSIGIGTEKLQVINRFDERKILRVKRGIVGGSGHALSSTVSTVPQKFTIPLVTDPFESKINDKVFFNPLEQVGLALTAGTVVAMGKSFTTGERSKVISVPAKSIFLPNHPFRNNQQLTFTIPSGAGNIVCGTGITQAVSANFNLTSGSTVFAKRISNDLVGLSTVKNGETIFFKTTPTDSFEYLLESNHTQVLGKAQKITSHVAVSTAHNLTELDKIDLNIESNRSGGLGISTSVIVKYSAAQDKILVNPLTIVQANIGADTIFKDDHGFKNGQKIFYDGNTTQATGLTTGTYFVYRISDDAFQLGETRNDVVNEPPRVVGITTNTGGADQQISLINPPLSVVNNNDLVFYVSDASLNGYEFNFYYDKLFKNEFVSTGTTSGFIIEKVGTVGVGTTSTITLKYHKDNPLNIYYAVEKSGFISTTDTDVQNGSRIDYVDSVYDGTYTAFGVGSTSFNISLKGVPEKLTYNRTEIDKMSYLTNSLSSSGGVGELNLASGGFGYKRIPGISSVTSVNGADAKILCLSDNINKINKVRILDPGFEYASDKTLKPEARISPTVTLINSDLITNIEVTSGGTDYLVAPDIVIVDPETGLLTDQGVIEVELSSSSISSVNIISSPRGLKPIESRVRTINNSNGISVQTVVGMANTTSVGVVTCTLVTPIGGFANPPFAVGDQIFVEGIQLDSSSGTGYNSTDYGYNFFKITDYQNASPAKLEFNLSGIATAVGVAKTSQQNYATITNFNKYPQFKTTQRSAQFTPGEKLAVRESGNFVLTDLSVLENTDEFIKVRGKRELIVGNIIRGEISGTVATINTISNNRGVFNIDYSLEQGRGWSNEIGKLSEDHQVIADNDYYQNLSYAIQSPQTFEEIIDPVNRLIHTAGLKNFADTGITSTAKSGISSDSALFINRDLITNERTDTINNFDYAVDTDTTLGGSQSKFLKLNNIKLSSYIECRTNRVLDIDDISSQFSNTTSTQDGKVKLTINDDYESFLIQTKNPATSEIQIDEVVVFKDSVDTFTFERNNLGIGTQKIVDVEGFTDSATSDTFLNLTPTNPFDDDLDIKIYRSKFNSPTAGINTLSVGFANVIGVAKTANPSATINLVSSPIGVTSAFYSTVEITDNVTNEKNLVDIYATHDGTNSYFSEYYVDSGTISNFSSNFIGTFTSNLTGGVLSIDFENTGINTATLRSKTVGFGTTSVGIGTFRFKDPAEIAGNERSINLQSDFKRVTSTSTIVGVDSNKFSTIKSIVKVAYGSTIAIHEVLATHNGTDTSIVHYPFISIGSTAGIGTFIANFANNKFNVRFNPDSGVTDAEVSAYSELFYTDLDFFNTPPDVVIGRVTETVGISLYNAVNGNRANKTEFELKHGGVPIFAKTFNPSDTAIVNAVTGEFSIKDHFFNTGEKLKYTPRSTFIGVNPVSMKIGSTTNLPTDVFAIRVDKDRFKLATTKNNANAGTAVTFTALGGGNAHQLEMDKKLEKSIVVVDGLIQSPIAFTPVNTTLVNNGGSISATDTIVSIAGISSIAQGDLLKVGTEILKVNSVGLGTLAIGPITGGGSFKLVGVDRGALGTTAASHNDNTAVRKFKGSFNIVDSKIHFTDAPKGSNFITKDASGLEFPRSDFHGRVYLRKDYTNNKIFDDISDGFTGLGATHIMKSAGANTIGIQTGGSIVLMNGIFQTPTTENNQGNNYDFTGDTTAGITTITFTGITVGGVKGNSETDVNLNQLPRGGMIVSLGSTGGLGVAPLAGAAVTAVKNNAGQITAVGVGTADRHGSGYRGTVAIGITDIAYEHRFVRSGIGSILSVSNSNNRYTALDAVYTSHTGYLDITLASGHGLTTSDTVGIDTGGLVFTCSKDHFVTEHPYPRSGPTPSNSIGGDPIVGIQTAITAVNGNVITIFVGQGGGGGTGASITATVGAGGTLAFTVAGAGISYTNPQIIVPDPSYEDLDVIGVSRLGIGATTDTGFGLKVSVNVGASSTVGVGSTLHTVESFKITRNGFGFKKGDVLRPVGLVTALGLSSKVSEFDLTVTEIFTDNFAAWDFGEFDNIDNIKNLQDGARSRFPLRLNGQLLSFEQDNRVDESSLIDMKDLLLIFVNGVLQEPGKNYNFEGGTTFDFVSAPETNDDIDIFFYKGTASGANSDTQIVDVAQTLKKGDVITVGGLPGDLTDTTQNPRTVIGISTSDTFETEIYTGPGIGVTFKPIINWQKQKIDKIIGGDVVSKSRDSLTSLIFPTARIIGNLGTGNDPDIFVDDAQFFEYEEDFSSLVINEFGARIVNDIGHTPAKFTATVSGTGQVTGVTVVEGGSGYVGSAVTLSIAAPIGVAATQFASLGVSTFASATGNITNGAIASVTMNNVGFGYTTTNPPKVVAPIPTPITEKLTGIDKVEGFSGIITAISVTSGSGGGTGRGLRVGLARTSGNFNTLAVGYPIYLFDTKVGNGVTSIGTNANNSNVVGIGTLFADNIYTIQALNYTNNTSVCEILVNIHSGVNTTGLSTSFSTLGDRGNFSWGRLFADTGVMGRDNPISLTVTGNTVGLTTGLGIGTFPIIERRSYGVRDTGAVKNKLS